jgi:four helix bundle protein
MFRSWTSVSSNLRAACPEQSQEEYYAKICIVVEENDEVLFWLELIKRSGICNSEEMNAHITETEKLLTIFAKTKKNIKL